MNERKTRPDTPLHLAAHGHLMMAVLWRVDLHAPSEVLSQLGADGLDLPLKGSKVAREVVDVSVYAEDPPVVLHGEGYITCSVIIKAESVMVLGPNPGSPEKSVCSLYHEVGSVGFFDGINGNGSP
jgi:hypothetical protein